MKAATPFTSKPVHPAPQVGNYRQIADHWLRYQSVAHPNIKRAEQLPIWRAALVSVVTLRPEGTSLGFSVVDHEYPVPAEAAAEASRIFVPV